MPYSPNRNGGADPKEGGTDLTTHEPFRPDRLGWTDADASAARLAEGVVGRKRGWPKGKKRTHRKTKLAVMGVPSTVLDTGNPAYARCVRLAAAYRKVRNRELIISHGYVSSGASALLASAAHALAASRYLYECAAQASPENMLEYLRTAAKLAESAKASELAAWELAKREGEARKKLAAYSTGTPWLIPVSEQRKPGPKKKEDPALMLPPVGEDLTVFIQDAKVVEEVINESRAGSATESPDGSGQTGDGG